MPDTIIARYLEQHSEKGFHEICSIFRHDYIQFVGMLQSWMALIEAEVMDTPVDAFSSSTTARRFKRAAADLQAAINRLYDDSRARLYPEPQPAECGTLLQQWQSFFQDFSNYAKPALTQSEAMMQRFVTQKDFERIIEHNLGAAAGDDTIRSLMLKPYERLQQVLDAHYFDARVAEILDDSRKNAVV
ncbi:MAG: hypothetical protein K8I30_09425 [Anaerolineae bacterium]|nr:hypothetical protein [Anaerolineae bacterium]